MDRLIATIAERFDLEVEAARRMDDGGEAAVWWLRTDRGAFVAHANPSWRTLSELVWIHRVIAHAAERLPEAVTPLAGADGETVFLFDGHPISLSPFVEGDWLDREDPDQLRASARLLARLHAAMANWRGGPRPPSSPANPGTWDPNDDPPELRDPALDSWWASIAPSLRKGVIHGDFYRRNILWRRGRIVALVDWHDARIAPFWDEVASAAWEMAHDRHRFLPDRAAAFLHAYGPDAPSLELAAPVIRLRLRDQVRYALARARHGEPLDEYVTPCLRAYTDLRDFPSSSDAGGGS